MSKCVFLRGLPGSGKTRTCEHQYPNHLRFNRDDFREANPGMKEKDVAKAEEQFMKDNVDKDIIIDNTHLSPSLPKKMDSAVSLGYKVEIHDMYTKTYIHSNIALASYLGESLSRNLQRERKVPESVIYQMFLSAYANRDYIGKCIIVDIDGTIANIDHRLHYIQTKPKDHDSFYAEVKNDSPIQDVIDLANLFYSEYTIIYVSGRRNQTYRDTKERMKKHGVKCDFILMRNGWDFRPDTEIKKEIYDKCLWNLDIVMVMDDRKCVQAMRSENGLRVLDCNSGRGEF